MKALVVGLGSIGQRHARNLRHLLPGAQVVALRRTGDITPDPAVRVVRTLEEALAGSPDLAIVCSPASCHLQDCMALARAGVPMLVEKPIAASTDGVQDLLDLCRSSSLVVAVGYHLRFSPGLLAIHEALRCGRIGRVMGVKAEVGQYLPDWRPGTDYRLGVSARKDMGGGVLRELSHEFDYLCWLMGEVEAVTGWAGRLSGLDIDVEDTAEAVLHFRSGAVGNVHLDMTQSMAVRSCRILGTGGALAWDGLTHQATLHVMGQEGWTALTPAGGTDRNALFVAELADFIRCVESGATPRVTGEDGLRALEVVQAVEASSSMGRTVQCKGR